MHDMVIMIRYSEDTQLYADNSRTLFNIATTGEFVPTGPMLSRSDVKIAP